MAKRKDSSMVHRAVPKNVAEGKGVRGIFVDPLEGTLIESEKGSLDECSSAVWRPFTLDDLIRTINAENNTKGRTVKFCGAA